MKNLKDTIREVLELSHPPVHAGDIPIINWQTYLTKEGEDLLVDNLATAIKELIDAGLGEFKHPNEDGLIKRWDKDGKDKWGDEYAEKFNERIFGYNHAKSEIRAKFQQLME